MKDTCPTCGRPYPVRWEPSRICAACGLPILKGHKFFFGPDSRVRHRVCENPDAYHEDPALPAQRDQAEAEVREARQLMRLEGQ